MQIAHILPVKWLNKVDTGSKIHMALTHLVRSGQSEYINYFKNLPEDHYVILDNSVIEVGEALTIDMVLEAAEIIDADEIILPDTLFDREKTMQAVVENKKLADSRFNIMAVPQGKNPKQWFECLRDIQSFDYIDTIGISKTLRDVFPGSRLQAVQLLDNKGMFDDKMYHLLGVPANAVELKVINNATDRIRSADSCIAYLNGVNGVLFNESWGAVRKSWFEMDFSDKFNNVLATDVNYNIKIMNEWVK